MFRRRDGDRTTRSLPDHHLDSHRSTPPGLARPTVLERRSASGEPRAVAGPLTGDERPQELQTKRESASEKLKDALLRLVGLGQHRGTGLGQDLRAAVGRHFHRHVGVTDT
jgi:hypothetical protein